MNTKVAYAFLDLAHCEDALSVFPGQPAIDRVGMRIHHAIIGALVYIIVMEIRPEFAVIQAVQRVTRSGPEPPRDLRVGGGI